MRTTRRTRTLASILGALALGLVVAPAAVAAKRKASPDRQAAKNGTDTAAKDATPVAGRGSAPPGVTLNACGCYRKGNACVCTNKNARCECLDDCEPVGCDEKRQKEMDREMAAEIKRAEEQDRKREADEKERARKAAEAEHQEQTNESAADDDADKADPGGAGNTGVKTADKAADKAGDRASDKAFDKGAGSDKASDPSANQAPAKPGKPPHRDKKKK